MDLAKSSDTALPMRLPPGVAVGAAVRRTLAHLADNKLASAAAYAGFVFAKVLAATGWRTSTALGVLNASSLPGVVAAATLSALPSLVLLVLSVILFVATSGRWRGQWLAAGTGDGSLHIAVRAGARRNQQLLGVTAMLVVAVLAVSSWTVSAILLSGAVIIGLLARTLGPNRRCLRGAQLLFAGVAAIVLYPRLVSSVWLPHQAVEQGSGAITVGYVVDSNGQGVTVLDARTRVLETIPASDVTRTYVCLPTDNGLHGLVPVAHFSVLELVLHLPAPDPCPAPRHRAPGR